MSSHPTPPAPLPRTPASNGLVADALKKSLATPLRAMRATVDELLRLQPALDPGADSLNGLLYEIQRLSFNVQELINHSQPPTPCPTRCSVAELAANLRASLPPQLNERVWIAFDARNPEVITDSVILTHALARLAINATEATGDNALVAFQVERTERYSTLRCTVADAAEGAPFSATSLPTPFFSEKPNHLGLGLSLARRDVALLGGTVRTHSGPTQATLVVTEIPTQPIPSAAASASRVAA